MAEPQFQRDLWRMHADRPALEVMWTHTPFDLLLVHGSCSTCDQWQPLMTALAEKGVSSAAVSLRGHGGSEGHENLHRWGLRDYVDDVQDVMDRNGRQVSLLGHSMANLIAAHIGAA